MTVAPTTIVKIGTQFEVNTQTAGGQWYPTVTGLANGGFVVTWQDGLASSNGSGSGTLGDNSFSSIKAQIYAADGTEVGSEFLVNTQTTGGQANPTITSLSTGGFVVTWQDQNSNSGDIKAQVYTANGTPSGSELTINSVTALNQNGPTITALSGGGFVAAWTSSASSGAPDIKAQVYNSVGLKVGSELLVNTTSINYDQERASISTLSNGDFVVTWNDFRTGNWEVRGQVFHPTGSGAAKVGSEFIVDTAFYNSRMTAGVTGLTNGNFIVSYEDTGGEIKSQLFSAGGIKIGTAFVVNTNTSGNQGFPSVTALTTGGFVVTWSDEGSPSDGSSSSIKAQVYGADGLKVGGEYLINSQPSSNQLYPTVAGLANGGFVVTWQDFSHALGDTAAYSISAQVFNLSNAPTAPAIVSITDDVGPVVGVVANGSSTNDTNLTVRIATGSNFPGDVIQLFDGTTAIGSAVTLTVANIAAGFVNIQTGVLSNATHAITAKVTDTTGAQSGTAIAVNVSIDTVAPAVAVTGVAVDTANLPVVTVNGTVGVSDAGQTVSVYDGATLVGTAAAGVDGSWSLAGVTLVEGANNLTATVTDAAGNTGTSSTFAAPTMVSTGTTTASAATITSMGYIVFGSGTLDVEAGANVTGQIIVGAGGVVFVETGASASNAVVSGGTLYDYGNASGTTINQGGAQHVYFGNASGTTVNQGGAQHVFFGGSAADTTVQAGGYQDVWNGTVTDTILRGDQQVLSGGTSVRTVIENGGTEFVADGGTAEGTVINTGGFQYVDAGGTATDTVITGGYQFIGGSASGTTVGGGQSEGGGVSTGATVQSGGAQHVSYGGSAIGTTVEAGGFQAVYNGTVTDTHLGGDQQVQAGGVAIHTLIASGATAYIGTGGTTDGTVIDAGGLQYLAAGSTSTDSVVNGGFEYVGGTANSTTVDGGGTQYVGSGGVANDTHVVSGTEYVEAGGTANGVDFEGTAGILVLKSPSSLTGTISNFELGDTIDLVDISVTSFDFDGSSLTLSTSGGNFSYQFADVQAGTEFNIASDGHGGSAISLSLLAQFSASLVPGSGADAAIVAQDAAPTEVTLTNVHA